MTETLKRIDDTTIMIEIGIDKEEFEKKYFDNLRKLAQNVRIRGFRPGKAPIPLVEKLVGPEVKTEIIIRDVTEKIKEILNREKIFPVNENYISPENIIMDEQNQVKYKCEIEVFPVFNEINFSELPLEEKKVVSDSTVEEVMTNLAYRKAPLVMKSKDEPASDRDVVVAQGSIEFDDPSVEPEEFTGRRIDLGPWAEHGKFFRDIFAGKKAGDVVEAKGFFALSRASQNDESNLMPGKMKCTIQEILARKLPLLDDEFAKDYHCENIDELRKKIRQELEDDLEEEWINSNGIKIIDLLIEKLNVPLPKTFRKIIEEKISYFEGEKKDKIKNDMELEIRRYVFARSIAYQNNLIIDDENLAKNLKALTEMLERAKMKSDEKEKFINSWLKEYQYNRLFRMVSKFLVDKVLESNKPGSQIPFDFNDKSQQNEIKKEDENGQRKE